MTKEHMHYHHFCLVHRRHLTFEAWLEHERKLALVEERHMEYMRRENADAEARGARPRF